MAYIRPTRSPKGTTWHHCQRSADTLTTIATGLKNAINADTKLAAVGLTATSAVAVITMTVAGGTGRTLVYDANSNMTSDGTNTYTWDGENRLILVTYPGTNNYSSFTYDGASRCVKIVETVAGSVTSTKQFVWCSGNTPCEARDGTGSITAQYFSRGQTIGGTTNKYCYSKDHLGSVRELTDSSGVIQAQYSYDPYGQATKLQGSLASDFGYAGYYFHAPSGLNLTRTRAYNAGLGRFISRDTIEEKGGINMYAYVRDNPISRRDPRGTCPLFPPPPITSWPTAISEPEEYWSEPKSPPTPPPADSTPNPNQNNAFPDGPQFNKENSNVG